MSGQSTPHVFGVHADTTEALAAAVEDAGLGTTGAWVAADLSLGAWRGHQVARELSIQLGLAPPRHSWPSRTRQQAKPSYADLVGLGIDGEGRGNEATLTALDAAESTAKAIRCGAAQVVVVLGPRFGLSWEPEDVLFIRLLAARLGTNGALVVAYAERPPASDELSTALSIEWINRYVPRSRPGQLDAGSLLRLVPGLVEPEVELVLASSEPDDRCAAAMLPLPSGCALVPTECRAHPNSVSRLDYDRLGAFAHDVDWLRAYAQCAGNNAFADTPFLTRQAWQRFAEGGGGIALKLLDRAAVCARSTGERAVADFQAQGMRIAMGRSAEVAAMPDPSPATSPELRAFLLLAKGYGLVMTGEIDHAERLLGEARALLETLDDEREYLYLLNIAALARAKSGDSEGALALELEIASRTSSSPRPDWRLRYVNLVNIARLSRKLGDLDAARDSYSQAFDTTSGSRSESEAVYTNFCLARIEAEQGRYRDALLCRLRAALHWVSARAPEALGTRVTAAIVGSLPASEGSLLESVSGALATSLAAAAKAAGIEAAISERSVAGAPRPPAFVRADALRMPAGPQTFSAVGGPGWGVVLAPELDPGAAVDLEETRLLRRMVALLLAGLSGGSEPFEAGSVIVDDRLGQEIAGTPHELVESALRLEASELSFEPGGRLQLDDETRSRLESGLSARLGSAVDALTETPSGVTVRFRRGLDDVVLPPGDAHLLRALYDRPAVGELPGRLGFADGVSGLLRRLRLLEAAHIVYLTCLEETFTTVGISWPSRAISSATSHR